jgi:hypothetical protein
VAVLTAPPTHLLRPGLNLIAKVGLAPAPGRRAAAKDVGVHALAKGGERVEGGLQALAVDEEPQEVHIAGRMKEREGGIMVTR